MLQTTFSNTYRVPCVVHWQQHPPTGESLEGTDGAPTLFLCHSHHLTLQAKKSPPIFFRREYEPMFSKLEYSVPWHDLAVCWLTKNKCPKGTLTFDLSWGARPFCSRPCSWLVVRWTFVTIFLLARCTKCRPNLDNSCVLSIPCMSSLLQ